MSNNIVLITLLIMFTVKTPPYSDVLPIEINNINKIKYNFISFQYLIPNSVAHCLEFYQLLVLCKP